MSLQQQLTSFFTDSTGVPSFPATSGGGGGGSSNTLNNGNSGTVGGGIRTIQPNVPFSLGQKAVTATYAATHPRYVPLCLAQIADVQMTSTSTPIADDFFSFFMTVQADGIGTAVILTPAVNTPATAVTGGTFQLQFNPMGVLPTVLPGSHTYVFNLVVLYSSKDVIPIALNLTTTGSFAAEVLACATV